MNKLVKDFSFLTSVLTTSEINEDLICAYPWVYEVSFSLKDEQSNEKIQFFQPYYALSYDADEDVEKRWRHDFSYINSTLENVSLFSMVECNVSSELRTSPKKKNKNLN